MSPPNAAILYAPDGYETSGRQIMGRHAAGEGFLKAFVGHSGVARLHCFAANEAHARRFAQVVKAWGSTSEVRWTSFGKPAGLREAGCLYLPGPGLAEQAWARRWEDNRAFSLCGVTHTTASANAMDALAGCLTAPLQTWDAIICTSAAVRTSVEVLLQDQERYLRDRFGATRTPRPQLPVIPLGVDCNAISLSPDDRVRWRSQLGIAEDHLAVLYMGRLSFHAKVHPLAGYLALQAAATRTGKTVHLIMAGWFANEAIEQAFRDGAKTFCPDVRVHFVDGCEEAVRREIWAAADVFTSLSDNIQETFGLSPLEAMAAGLPVVATDWDGYRDTVRDGVDGILVPTWLAPAGWGRGLAMRFALGEDSYDQYIGQVCQFGSVDVEATAEAFVRLFLDEGLRRRMGEAGQKRARETYDWPCIVGRYQALWAELAELRSQCEESVPRAANAVGQPTRPDPFSVFACYPTHALRPEDKVRWIPARTWEMLDVTRQHSLVSYARRVLPSDAALRSLVGVLVSLGETDVQTVAKGLAPGAERWVPQALVWLHKLGFVTLVREA